MSNPSETPVCKLCRSKPADLNSHVLSKLGYRRYVANRANGGSCIKLDNLKEDSRQLTRNWFCEDCEQRFGEDYAARFLDKLERNRSDCRYDGELLRYIVSCSWRTGTCQ